MVWKDKQFVARINQASFAMVRPHPQSHSDTGGLENSIGLPTAFLGEISVMLFLQQAATHSFILESSSPSSAIRCESSLSWLVE